MRLSRASFAAAPVLGLALLTASCGQNPLASGTPGAGSAVFNRPAEIVGAGTPGLFYAPQSAGGNSTDSFLQAPATGAAILDYGGHWTVYQTGGVARPAAPNYDVASVWLRTGDSFSNNPNDYYLRYQGFFTGGGLINPSSDYNQLQVFYNSATGPGVDISSYHGFTFYTRGTGNFAVSLLSGSQANAPPQPGPYVQLNFYLAFFNTALTGSLQWKQVTVYFADMQQLYGLQTNLQQVLQNFYGLQFSQPGSPGPAIATSYRLDLDYIRFF